MLLGTDARARQVAVVERSSTTNFFEDGYTLYNQDIKAHVGRGGSAADHFRQHGKNEVRFQFTPEFIAHKNGNSSRARYERYCDVLGLQHRKLRFIDRE